MSSADELVLSGGGSVAVATDALFATVAELRRFAGHAAATGIRVAALPPAARAGDVSPGGAAERRLVVASDPGDVADASRALRDAAERADSLARSLQCAAENYGELERRAIRLSRAAEGWVAERAGAWLPALLLPLLPAASAAALGLLLTEMLQPRSAARAGANLTGANLTGANPTGADPMIAEPTGVNPRAGKPTAHGAGAGPTNPLLTDPRAVGLLRSLVLSSDDFGAGTLRAPPGTAAMLGENGVDLVGLSGTAGLLVASATRFGAVREGTVRVRESRRSTVASAPAGFRDRADRVPTGHSQIRVERYSSAGRPDRFGVFLGGTRAAGFLGGDEPWDMTSNLHAVAERSPGSRRAAEEAMRRSGMTAESEVVFTGYSQGGLLATQLAASGDWNAQGLVTFGAPVGGLDLPETFPAVQIEHTDDLVPAFGGDRTDLGPVVVRREAFAGRDVPPDVAVPAHRLAEYRSTAELLDEARSPTVERSAARLHAVGSGAERVEVTYYRADRVPGRD